MRIAHQLIRLQLVLPQCTEIKNLLHLHQDVYQQLCEMDEPLENLGSRLKNQYLTLSSFQELMSSVQGRFAGITVGRCADRLLLLLLSCVP